MDHFTALVQVRLLLCVLEPPAGHGARPCHQDGVALLHPLRRMRGRGPLLRPLRQDLQSPQQRSQPRQLQVAGGEREVELDAKVHMKVRNHGEGPY